MGVAAWVMVLVGALSWGRGVVGAHLQKPNRPHLVLIVADDLGWNDVPWHNPGVVAPNLASLANGGVLLESSYVQPICTPTRSALLTGRYPFTIGRQHGVLWPKEPTGLTLHAKLLPECLKEAGYSTHAVGKWHLGFCSWEYTPTKRGFDSFYGFYTGSEDYYRHTRVGHRDSVVHKSASTAAWDFRNNTEPDMSVNGVYSTYLFASYVEQLLESRSPDDPMFLYLPLQSVHSPLQVPENYTKPYSHVRHRDRRIKLGMVTAMDEAVGRVVSALKSSGHYDNSVIVFTTDNGGPTVTAGNNWPLRGNKSTLWEGGTRGAAFIHSPLLPNPGTVSHGLVHVTDWYTTLVGLGGGEVPAGLDGWDQWGALTGSAPSPRKHFVYNIDHTDRLSAGIRMGDYKLLVGYPGPGEWTPPPEFQHLTPSTETPATHTTYNNTPSNGLLDTTVILNDTSSNITFLNPSATTESNDLESLNAIEMDTIVTTNITSDMSYLGHRSYDRINDTDETLFDERSQTTQLPSTTTASHGETTTHSIRLSETMETQESIDNATTITTKPLETNQNFTRSTNNSHIATTSHPNSILSVEQHVQFSVNKTSVSMHATDHIHETGKHGESGLCSKLSSHLPSDGGERERKILRLQEECWENLLRGLPIRLFNLKDDPDEHSNIADQHTDVTKVLLEVLRQEALRYVPADIQPDCPKANPEYWHNIWSPGWC